jgi:Flp pilus assembly protein TadG
MAVAFNSLLSARRRIRTDCRGVSAVEFALILPVLLVLLTLTFELSNGVAIDRKVTITARTLSDLVSQDPLIHDSDILNTFAASSEIVAPYSPQPLYSIISEIKIDAGGLAKIVWSKASSASIPHNIGDQITLPPALRMPNTYLIWGEAKYIYTPVIGYISKTALTLRSEFFARPRQSLCVIYNDGAKNNPASC